MNHTTVVVSSCRGLTRAEIARWKHDCFVRNFSTPMRSRGRDHDSININVDFMSSNRRFKPSPPEGTKRCRCKRRPNETRQCPSSASSRVVPSNTSLSPSRLPSAWSSYGVPSSLSLRQTGMMPLKFEPSRARRGGVQVQMLVSRHDAKSAPHCEKLAS